MANDFCFPEWLFLYLFLMLVCLVLAAMRLCLVNCRCVSSFPLCCLPLRCLPRQLPLRFFFPSVLLASALFASFSLDAFALPSSPSLFRNVGRRLPSLLVLFGWLVRLARVFFSFVRFCYSSVIGCSLCLFLMVYRWLRSAFSYAASWLRLSVLLKWMYASPRPRLKSIDAVARPIISRSFIASIPKSGCIGGVMYSTSSSFSGS